MKPYIDPSDRPDHDYFPDTEEEREKDPIRDHGPIVKVLDIMRSRNKFNRPKNITMFNWKMVSHSGSTRMPLMTSKLCKILFNQSNTFIYGDFFC